MVRVRLTYRWQTGDEIDQHPTCTWFRCPACLSTIDLIGRRGWHDKAGAFALPTGDR